MNFKQLFLLLENYNIQNVINLLPPYGKNVKNINQLVPMKCYFVFDKTEYPIEKIQHMSKNEIFNIGDSGYIMSLPNATSKNSICMVGENAPIGNISVEAYNFIKSNYYVVTMGFKVPFKYCFIDCDDEFEGYKIKGKPDNYIDKKFHAWFYSLPYDKQQYISYIYIDNILPDFTNIYGAGTYKKYVDRKSLHIIRIDDCSMFNDDNEAYAAYIEGKTKIPYLG